MNNQQQHSQTPQGQQQPGQLPEHRLQELETRLRQAELENQRLRTTIDVTMRQQNPGQQQGQQQPGSAFKPEVLNELKALIDANLAPVRQQMEHQMGMFYDQIDDTRYRQQYSDAKWAPYHEKAERLRQDQIARNNWITREQALQMVYFEETGKKAAPQPQQQQAPTPKQPVWSPYLQTMVDPDTGLPPVNVAQPAPQTQQFEPGFDPAEGRQQPTTQQQHQQVPHWQQQQAAPQTQTPQPQGTMPQGFHPQHQHGMNANHPHANPFGVQRPNLPGQGINPQAQVPRGPATPVELDLGSSDADLEAFESKFGDIPL